MFKFNEYVAKRNMSLELLNKRLEYQGGNQQERFINNKLKTLKKALLYSYQAATAILSDGRQFRCLINPDKNKPAYDNKILSIPYKDICLNAERIGKTSQGQVQINIKPGDVFTWKETNTHWIVYLQALQEDAYFRSEIRRCDQHVNINGKSYWVYIRGPVETSIEWNKKAGIEWNSLNWSLIMYITKDQNTQQYFRRFQKVKVELPNGDKKTWQVAGVDPYYGDGIIQVALDEYFENSIEEAIKESLQQQDAQDETTNENQNATASIEGTTKVSQYSRESYTIKNAENGSWFIIWKGVQYNLNTTATTILLQIPVGDLEIFTLIYRVSGQEDVTLEVSIVPM